MTTEIELLDKRDIRRTVRRMANEILEVHKGTDKLALVGIQTRGVYLAKRLQQEIEAMEGTSPLLGEMDITFYRDDWTRIGGQPVVKPTAIPFAVDGLSIILVDDVLFTGRTIRAAMDALTDFGRPSRIELAVLADRSGHRELPIQANYIGKLVKTSYSQTVNVLLEEHDGTDRVIIE